MVRWSVGPIFRWSDGPLVPITRVLRTYSKIFEASMQIFLEECVRVFLLFVYSFNSQLVVIFFTQSQINLLNNLSPSLLSHFFHHHKHQHIHECDHQPGACVTSILNSFQHVTCQTIKMRFPFRYVTLKKRQTNHQIMFKFHEEAKPFHP